MTLRLRQALEQAGRRAAAALPCRCGVDALRLKEGRVPTIAHPPSCPASLRDAVVAAVAAGEPEAEATG